MAKVENRYDELKAVGVSSDASIMSDAAILKTIHDRFETRNSHEWELGYFASTLWRKGAWRDRVRTPTPSYRQFFDYLYDEIGIDTSESRRLIACMETYVQWAPFGEKDSTIVDVIKQIGISKPHICTSYMNGISLDQARALIDLCQQTPASRLREAARALLKGTTPKSVDAALPAAKIGGAARATVNHLSWAADRLIAGELFVPRQKHTQSCKEISWSVVFETARKSSGLSVDEQFAELMQVWAERLPKSILAKANELFEYEMSKRNEAGEFLYGEKRRAKAA